MAYITKSDFTSLESQRSGWKSDMKDQTDRRASGVALLKQKRYYIGFW